MFGKTKQLEDQVKSLQQTVADRDASIKRLTQTLSETQDLVEQTRATNARLIDGSGTHPSAPEVERFVTPVTDVAIKTAGLVKGDDVLVGSDGFSFWEIGRVADHIAGSSGNPTDLRLVKR